MQKNLYFRTVLRRRNALKEFIYDMFLAVASYPRMLLEVFIRKNFGQRYFSLASLITVGVILAILPWISTRISIAMSGGYSSYGSFEDSGETPGFWGKYVTWFLFLFAFLYVGYKRWKEVKSLPSVFDFEKYSLYSGDIHPAFLGLSLFSRPGNTRMIATVYEPGLFFLIGLVLWVIGQPVGALLTVSSIFYSIGYLAAYKNGDNFVMDKIDEMILNEELEDAFVNDKDASETRGVRFYARKPNGEDLRRRVADAFMEEEEPVTEAL